MTEQTDIDDPEDEVALDATEDGESLLSSLMLPVCILIGLSIVGIVIGISFL
ncbi:hypothetical protein [Gluconobacter frateurii]|uniref:Uncharacterized protein n=1 Tax=Gluconobacter frateurii NRIC 0228 TaxID=1307946 RepID=A0ABQ0QE55_9PROT|nr:hypothetical protein [Gluconobacter frateurii]OAG72595.1 hypothetical protein A0J51_02038 [Gluconobacter japonicus]UMM08463.1 hypothetical protein MKW11_14945 [Gluconobacter frateurii]GBR15323.1 hypothetical protein AA0228_2482 [Gluconobacter frateurii NRIC 0228]GLP90279.1 hypothetical protein GCM10007868_13540 [Gluconobacter frateurii]